MEIQSLGFRTDLALLQKTGSEIEDRGTHLVIRTPGNPTFFWGNFILLGQPPLPGGEREVIGAFRTEFPDAKHVTIGIDVTEDPGEMDAWRHAGMSVYVTSVLTARSLVQPPAPALDVEVRPLESDEDWEQRLTLGRSFYPDVDEETYLGFARGKNVQERALAASPDGGARFGAFVDGVLVASAGIFVTEPGVARFQMVETHPDHRRQGIAATVVHAAGRHAVDALGVERLVMVAETDADAIRIYRRLGFEDLQRQVAIELPASEWAGA